MKKFLPTIILLIILIGLGLFYFLYEKNQETRESKIEKQKTYQALDINQGDISELSLVYPDQTIILTKKDDGSWETKTSTRGVEVGSKEKIESYLDNLVDLESSEKISVANDELAEFGLDNPELKIEIKTKDKSQTILIGNSSPIGTNKYVKVESDNFLSLVSKSQIDELKKKEGDFKN